MRPASISTAKQPHRRWLIWLPLLAIAGFLALQEPPANAPQEVVNPITPHPGRAAGAVQVADTPRLTPLIPRAELVASTPPDTRPQSTPPDLFGPRSWTPPPPPLPTPPPRTPTAPPLPFTFLGKKLQDGQWEVYLANGDFTYVVREGQTFASVYQVKSIRPPDMTLTYVPLDQSQVFVIGDEL